MGLLFGRINRLNREKQAGEIIDQWGRTFWFFSDECEGGQLPIIGSTVTFYRDPRYSETRMAELIKVDSTPSDPIEHFLHAIGED